MKKIIIAHGGKYYCSCGKKHKANGKDFECECGLVHNYNVKTIHTREMYLIRIKGDEKEENIGIRYNSRGQWEVFD